MAEFN